jgi:lipid A 3-O-deacylase
MTHPPTLRPPALLALLLALGAAAVPGSAPAQAFRTWEVATDNDAYDFWIPPYRRPDHDYTHGMWIAAELDRAPWWGRRLGGGLPSCTGREAGSERCLSTRLELGQKIFTPGRDGATPVPGERAYAGWLYVTATGRREGPRTRTTGSVELGVTGNASLGRALHEEFHRLAGFWAPDGWHNQLAFEPGVVARLDRQVLALDGVTAGGVRWATVVPEGGVAVGNVLTGAQVGARAHLGYGVPHPWRPLHSAAPPSLSLYALGAAREDYVAHDLFLDGNTFRESVHVDRRPLVWQYEVGGGLRWKRVGAEYRVTTRGREYETQVRRHQWSSISLTLDRVR